MESSQASKAFQECIDTKRFADVNLTFKSADNQHTLTFATYKILLCRTSDLFARLLMRGDSLALGTTTTTTATTAAEHDFGIDRPLCVHDVRPEAFPFAVCTYMSHLVYGEALDEDNISLHDQGHLLQLATMTLCSPEVIQRLTFKLWKKAVCGVVESLSDCLPRRKRQRLCLDEEEPMTSSQIKEKFKNRAESEASLLKDWLPALVDMLEGTDLGVALSIVQKHQSASASKEKILLNAVLENQYHGMFVLAAREGHYGACKIIIQMSEAMNALAGDVSPHMMMKRLKAMTHDGIKEVVKTHSPEHETLLHRMLNETHLFGKTLVGKIASIEWLNLCYECANKNFPSHAIALLSRLFEEETQKDTGSGPEQVATTLTRIYVETCATVLAHSGNILTFLKIKKHLLESGHFDVVHETSQGKFALEFAEKFDSSIHKVELLHHILREENLLYVDARMMSDDDDDRVIDIKAGQKLLMTSCLIYPPLSDLASELISNHKQGQWSMPNCDDYCVWRHKSIKTTTQLRAIVKQLHDLNPSGWMPDGFLEMCITRFNASRFAGLWQLCMSGEIALPEGCSHSDLWLRYVCRIIDQGIDKLNNAVGWCSRDVAWCMINEMHCMFAPSGRPPMRRGHLPVVPASTIEKLVNVFVNQSSTLLYTNDKKKHSKNIKTMISTHFGGKQIDKIPIDAIKEWMSSNPEVGHNIRDFLINDIRV